MKKSLLFRFYARFISSLVFVLGFTASVCAQYGAPVYERMVFKGFIKSNEKNGNVAGLKVTAKSKNHYNQEVSMVSDKNGNFNFTSGYYYHYYFRDSTNILIENPFKQVDGKSQILVDTSILMSDGQLIQGYTEHGREQIDHVFEEVFYINNPETSDQVLARSVVSMAFESHKHKNQGKSVPVVEETTTGGIKAEQNSQTLRPEVNNSENQQNGNIYYEDPLKNPEVKIYPNPGNGLYNFVFKTPGISDFRISVFDLQGQLVTSFQLNNIAENQNYTMDISRAAAGSYLIRIENQQWSFSTIVVKNQ